MQPIAIFGVPRSGTSWLGQIFNSSPHVLYRYQPIFSYSFPYAISEDSTTEEIKQFYRELVATDDDFVCQNKNIFGNTTPSFDKREITHLVWKEVRYLNVIDNLIEKSSTKVIGIIRHPCGVINSWVSAPKEFDSSWDIHEQWRYAEKKNTGPEDFYGYEHWLDATRMFLSLEEARPGRFRTVTYESLLQNLQEEVEELYAFAGLSVTVQTESFLEKSTAMSSNDPYDVYRKDKDSKEWNDQLPESIIQEILNDPRFKELSRRFGWD